MIRGSIAQAPMSQPASPTRLNRNAVFASGVASLMSDAMARIAPAPTATPSTAAMIGLPQVSIALTRSPVMRVKPKSPFMSSSVSGPMMSSTSPPELKLPPLGAMTTAWISSSSTRSRNQSRSAA